ncbi:hypothetical protein BDF14DRAFT_813156 [Spinellus fusiger]|nr:hypothetical protein BDF14DRAFT_813156 [Spinellus fusiger]
MFRLTAILSSVSFFSCSIAAMLSAATETATTYSALYTEHALTLQHLEKRLLHAISLLGLSFTKQENAAHYISDKGTQLYNITTPLSLLLVTLFRYLKDCNYEEEKAYTCLLDTVQWRLQHAIDQYSWQTVANEFYSGSGFAFFYKQDYLGRPVALIRLRHFPTFADKSKALSDWMYPFACFVLELARKKTRDITREREASHQPTPLVSQIIVLIDIANAPFVAVDSQLIGRLRELTNARYPGFIGAVYILNFGWMYQGLWQMVKMLLSDHAKQSVSFLSTKEIQQIIPIDCLLKELGGTDDYQWSLENDSVLQAYGLPSGSAAPDPSTSSLCSPSLSSYSSDSNDSYDLFFDAYEGLSSSSSHYHSAHSAFRSRSTSIYATPGASTGIATPLPMTMLYDLPYLSRSTTRPTYHWSGLHMGEAFLTSFVNSSRIKCHGISALALASRLAMIEQDQLLRLALQEDLMDDRFTLQEDLVEDRFTLQDTFSQDRFTLRTEPHFPHLLPSNLPHSSYASAPVRTHLLRSEQRIVRFIRHLFRLSFRHHGALYWLLLYLFLRGPVEHSVKRALVRFLTHTPQTIAYTTIGITATLGAALGTSFSSTLSHWEGH